MAIILVGDSVPFSTIDASFSGNVTSTLLGFTSTSITFGYSNGDIGVLTGTAIAPVVVNGLIVGASGTVTGATLYSPNIVPIAGVFGVSISANVAVNDTVPQFLAQATAGNDLIGGGAAPATLGGGAGNDTIISGAGATSIVVGSGTDIVGTGAGATLIFDSPHAGIDAFFLHAFGNGSVLVGLSTNAPTVGGVFDAVFGFRTSTDSIGLPRGVAGINTGADAMARAVFSDNHGGTLIIDGVALLDLVGVAPQQLSAANFVVV